MKGAPLALLTLASCGDAAFQNNGMAGGDGNASMKPSYQERSEVNAATNAGTPVDGPWLVLEFPDGARGGTGRIQGTGPRPTFPGPGTNGVDPDFFGSLLRQIRECGAVEPSLDRRRSHSFLVISRSTAGDRKVVECLARATSLHFTPRLRTDDPAIGGMDPNPFADLFTHDADPAPKK